MRKHDVDNRTPLADLIADLDEPRRPKPWSTGSGLLDFVLYLVLILLLPVVVYVVLTVVNRLTAG